MSALALKSALRVVIVCDPLKKVSSLSFKPIITISCIFTALCKDTNAVMGLDGEQTQNRKHLHVLSHF